MRRWFTSDQHFGHTNIIAFCDRPFNSVWHMRTALIENWNACVQPDDEVYVLGDFTMGSANDLLNIGRELSGVKFLVPGNHDLCWRGKSRPRPAMYIEAGFAVLDDVVDLTLEDGRAVRLCHFPVAGDHTVEDRFTHYRPTVGEGQWLLHGHVHNAWGLKDRQINVGVDVWDYYPVSETEILNLMDLRDLIRGHSAAPPRSTGPQDHGQPTTG